MARQVSPVAIALLLVVGSAPQVSAEAGPKAPTVALPGIAFVAGPIVDRTQDQAAGAYHWRDGYVYPKGATNNAWERTTSAPRPGRNLFSLVPARPDGKLTQLTFLTTGEVYDPEPSYDGRRLLFSMRKDGEDWYHLFEMNIDGTGLRQLTDGPFNDISGVYLPDGKIVFCSDRSGVLDEYHEERSEFLFSMRADGSGIEQLTFVPGIYFEPTVLKNGLILCSFWDAFHISVAPFIKHETYLITLRPDGTEERPLFGAGQYKFYNRNRHSAIGLTRPGELPDGRILVQSEMGPSVYDPNLGIALAQSLTPVFPATTSVQTGGTTFSAHLSPTGTRSSPYPLPDGRFLMAATAPGSRDIGLYAVNPDTRQTELLFDRPNVSEWDAVPIGLSRAVPRMLPEKVRDKESPFATFIVVDTHAADTPERVELNQRARFARVLQAEYTDVTTSSHTSLETRILGTVPIFPDGSIAFEAPAETPLFVETLDARGQRLVLQAGYMSARAGEVKSCFGCHAPQSDAVPNTTLQALAYPLTRITRESTDLSYRRNEPDEYRRQALITQAPVYREWLTRTEPEIQRRGIEALTYLPDEVTTADRAQFVKLLANAVPSVRRQAAHALAIVGSPDQILALLAALNDADWQTRSYAAMALEAVTGENLELQADLRRAEAVWNAWWKKQGSLAHYVRTLTTRAAHIEIPFVRDAWLEAVARTAWIADPAAKDIVEAERAHWFDPIRTLLKQDPPLTAAVRAAGWLQDSESVVLIAPYLVRGQRTPVEESVPDSDDALAREARGTALAKEAVTALGRIRTPEAIALLWERVEKHVPDRAPIASRHYQTGPRPEEYTALRALIYANVKPTLEQIPFVIALSPFTEGEKPRFEDRMKSESQRVLLTRVLLERTGVRPEVIGLANSLVRGDADPKSQIYQLVLKGMNIDRPISEHARLFPVLQTLSAEQGVHLLANVALSRKEIDEPALAKLLTSTNHRERIDAAVVFRRFGFGPETEAILRAEVAKPYAFSEIWSIGKGRADPQFRDKAYLVAALAAHADDLHALGQFTDYTRFYRDIRIGLAIGLGFRARPDALPLLTKLAHDPIFSVHRECQQAAIAIRDAELFAGRPAELARLPMREPNKPEYPSAKFAFAQSIPAQPATPAVVTSDPTDSRSVLAALTSAVDASKYANVGNGFARNATRMRIQDSAEVLKILDSGAVLKEPLTPELEHALKGALDSPYPFAHYVASRLIALRQDATLAEHLAKKLPEYVAAADTVGFYWAADALGRLKSPLAGTALAPFATGTPQPNTFGSAGMAYGFAAARGLGLTGDRTSKSVADLLTSDNVWLRMGVLDGLIDRGDATIADQLRTLAAESPSALLEAEARYGLHHLNAGGD